MYLNNYAKIFVNVGVTVENGVEDLGLHSDGVVEQNASSFMSAMWLGKSVSKQEIKS